VVLRVAALLGLACALAGAASASGTADLDIGLQRLDLSHAPVQVGAPFPVRVLVGNSGTIAAHAGVVLTVPVGLRVIARGSLGCPLGSGGLDCGDGEIPAGADGALGTAPVVADAPGSYTLKVEFVRLDVDDPDLADNTATLAITAVAAAPKLAVSGFALTPAAPKAGRPFRASFTVVDAGGARVAPALVACSARVGGTVVRARGSLAVGRASCTFLPPASARGKVLRGSIGATAQGSRVTRAFTVRLG
jgi:hypothetical protein